MSSSLREIVSGILASLVFIFLCLILKQNIILSFIIAFIGYLGLKLTFKSSREKKYQVSGVKEDEFESYLEKANDYLKKIKKHKAALSKSSQQLDLIIEKCQDISEFLRKKPELINNLLNYIELFLPKLEDIISNYVKLKQHTELSEEQKKQLDQFETITLVNIHNRLKADYEACLKDDFSKLEGDVKALEWINSGI